MAAPGPHTRTRVDQLHEILLRIANPAGTMARRVIGEAKEYGHALPLHRLQRSCIDLMKREESIRKSPTIEFRYQERELRHAGH